MKLVVRMDGRSDVIMLYGIFSGVASPLQLGGAASFVILCQRGIERS
jgi:hypothetical protein